MRGAAQLVGDKPGRCDAISGEGDRRSDQVGEVAGAVRGVKFLHAGDEAGDARLARRDLAAVGDNLAVVVGHRILAELGHDRGTPAADPRGERLDDTDGIGGGDGRVDRVAAVGEDPHARIDRIGVPGADPVRGDGLRFFVLRWVRRERRRRRLGRGPGGLARLGRRALGRVVDLGGRLATCDGECRECGSEAQPREATGVAHPLLQKRTCPTRPHLPDRSVRPRRRPSGLSRLAQSSLSGGGYVGTLTGRAARDRGGGRCRMVEPT